MQKRLDYIDLAKAIAIISVVMGHVTLYDLYGFENSNESSLQSVVATYHNYLFMFLSGMVSITTIEKSMILRDVYKRFRNLIIPALAIGIPYAYFTGADIIVFFTNPWKWGYWYLFVLFDLYLISYPIALLNSRQLRWLYLMILPLWLYIYRHTYPIPQVIRDVLDIDFIVKFFPYFFAGSIMKRHNLHEKIFNIPVLILCIIVTFLQGYIYMLLGRYLVEYVITFAEIISIITLCKYSLMGGAKYLTSVLYVGRNTLYIYVFHYIAIVLMTMPSVHEWFVHNSNLVIDLMAVTIPTIIAVAFSLATKNLLEKSSLVMKLLFYKDAEKNKN